MSVRVKDRTESKLTVQLKAEELARYTVHICSNPKNFNPAYVAMIDKMCNIAIDAFECIYLANTVFVGSNGELYEKRRGLQQRAIDDCLLLIADIQMSEKMFKLRSKRIKFWTTLASDTMTLAKSWRDSDTTRYLKSGV